MSELIYMEDAAIIGAGQGAPQNRSAFDSVGRPFIRAGSLESLCAGGDLAPLEKVNDQSAKAHKLKLYPQNTVVFAKSGMSAMQNRVYQLPEPCFVVNHLATLQVKPNTDSTFLRHFWQHLRPSNLIQDQSYPSISLEAIASTKVSLPPLPEQQRIAATLERADHLRRTRRFARQTSDSFLQSVFLKMFGDLTTNDRGWDSLPLGELLSSGPQNGLYKPNSSYGSGTQILRIDAFYDGIVTGQADLKRVRLTSKEMSLYQLNEDDIVINRVNSRSHLGKSAVIVNLKEPTVFESNMMRFSVDCSELDVTYFIQYLQTKFIKRQILHCAKDAVNQSSINQEDVTTLVVRVPPLSLQREFAAIMRRFERFRAGQIEAERQANHLFETLLHRAFSTE